ncbi:unnamed protein product [Porites lobata]|uniref:Uncharacterized protein n=1 Tax=Porites lobata TaxID=104759 RepID=A0ABN8NZD7_9CNID|nr:unnamed protein product [Porites lobata]
MPNDQKESEGSSVRAEAGQTSGDSGGNSAAVDQVFSKFKDFLEKKLEDKGKQIEQRSKLDKEAVETLLATSFAVSNAANLDTGPRTVDPCSGREVTSPLATILALESRTTSQPQANQLNQSNEDYLAQVDQMTQNYELESGHSLSVKGNLKNNLGFWRSIGAPDFILSIIENGYRLPFISFPLAVKRGNNKSARLHADFVDQAVLELVNSGRVRIVNEQPFVVNPLSVSIQPCGKKRLILDLCHALAVRGDLYNAGFVVNEDKSVWEPTQVLDWLGITWNSALGTLKIVERRILKIISTIDHIIEADFKVSIISTGPVVGNIGRIMTRHCVLSTLCKDNWDSVFRLDDYCKEELYFWKENMVNINSRYCFVSKDPIYFVYSDASATGGGAIIDFNNDFVCHKIWSGNERVQSSTWRELSRAVGTLVVPLWPSAHFWPLITHKYSSYLVAHSIHIGNEVLTRGRNLNSLLGSDLFTGNIIAFRLKFTE